MKLQEFQMEICKEKDENLLTPEECILVKVTLDLSRVEAYYPAYTIDFVEEGCKIVLKSGEVFPVTELYSEVSKIMKAYVLGVSDIRFNIN